MFPLYLPPSPLKLVRTVGRVPEHTCRHSTCITVIDVYVNIFKVIEDQRISMSCLSVWSDWILICRMRIIYGTLAGRFKFLTSDHVCAGFRDSIIIIMSNGFSIGGIIALVLNLILPFDKHDAVHNSKYLLPLSLSLCSRCDLHRILVEDCVVSITLFEQILIHYVVHTGDDQIGAHIGEYEVLIFLILIWSWTCQFMDLRREDEDNVIDHKLQDLP